MKRVLLTAIILLIATSISHAQYIPPTLVDLRDEGTSQGVVRVLNCTGSGLVCSVSAGIGTIDGAAGGGGGLSHPEVMIRASYGGF